MISDTAAPGSPAPPSTSLGAPGTATPGSRAAAFASRHRWLLVVLGAYALSAFLVPTLAPVAISDDPLHARSVEILMRQGHLEVLPLVVTSLVGQVLWAAPFAWLFGDTLGVLRVATVVMVGLSALPMYGLLRELHVTRTRSALGTALYLFNPLTYALAFTFMSDAYLVAGLIASTYCFVRAVNRSALDSRWLTLGSVFAGFTFLVRQQAALIVIAVAAFLWLTGELARAAGGARRLARLVGPFAAIAGLYYFWYHVIQGTPAHSAQVNVSSQLFSVGPLDAFVLVRRLTFFEVMYVALFLLPLVLASIPALRSLVGTTTRAGWIVLAAWGALVVLGLTWFGNGRARMPYLTQFAGPSGLGPPNDVRGGRAPLISPTGQAWLTGVCAIATLALALILVHRLRARRGRPAATATGVVFALLVGQAVAAVVSSYPLFDTAISRDRYLLPLLPLAIALTLRALHGVRVLMPIAWAGVVVFAAVSVLGVHDFLSFQSTVWQTAAGARADGVALRSLDGGAAWDAYHLYEYSYQHDIKLQLPTHLSKKTIRELKKLKLSEHDSEAWWIGFYAPATNSRYVVSAEPLLGYRVVSRRTWYSWYRQRDEHIYLLRRTTLTPAKGR